MDAAALAAGLRDTLALAELPGRAARARHLVRSQFTIDAMADALVPVYAAAAAARGSVAA
jgi:hypothetical protein